MMPDGDTVLPKAVANLTYFGNAMTGDSQVIDGEYALPMVVPEGPFRLEVSTGAVSCTNNEDDCALPVELWDTAWANCRRRRTRYGYPTAWGG